MLNENSTREQVLAVVAEDGWSIKNASAAFKDDIEICRIAVAQNPDSAHWISERCKQLLAQ